MSLQAVKSQAGFGIVESMLAAMILLFVLSIMSPEKDTDFRIIFIPRC